MQNKTIFTNRNKMLIFKFLILQKEFPNTLAGNVHLKMYRYVYYSR